MEESLSNEYWKKRCELAEKVIKLGMYDVMRMTDEHLVSFGKWGDFIKSPTDTALYTGFTDLLKANDMRYEFNEPYGEREFYELRFWFNGADLKQGCIVTSGTVYSCFELGLEMLEEMTLNTKS